jgi:hypothetical protein
VPLALVFAHKQGSGLEAPRALCPCPIAPRQTGKMLGDFRIKSPKRLLLEVPAKKPRDEILGVAWRRSCAKRRTPQAAELVEAERPNAVDLGLDRLAIKRGTAAWQSGSLAS